ncbi:MAG: YbjN domain-containing protein [Polyangiaceae bacterium]
MAKEWNEATRVSCSRIEEALAQSPAFTRVDSNFYVVRQGTAYVYIQVLPWGADRALVRMVAQLARDVEMNPDLAITLLRVNARIRFGAFGYVMQDSCVVLAHTLLGGDTLDAEEVLTAVRDITIVADEYDDRIVEAAGGKRMQDLIDASAAAALFAELDAPGDWDSARSDAGGKR